MTNGNEPQVYYLPFSPEHIKAYQILKEEGKLIRNLTTIDDACIELPGKEESLTLKLTLQIDSSQKKEVSYSSKSDIEGIMNDLEVKQAEDLVEMEVFTYWHDDKTQPEPVLKLVGISAVPHKKK